MNPLIGSAAAMRMEPPLDPPECDDMDDYQPTEAERVGLLLEDWAATPSFIAAWLVEEFDHLREPLDIYAIERKFRENDDVQTFAEQFVMLFNGSDINACRIREVFKRAHALEAEKLVKEGKV